MASLSSLTRVAFAAGAALFTAAAPSASAATISVSGRTATLTASPGEANVVRAVSARVAVDTWALDVTDTGAPLVAGPGCVAGAAGVTCQNVNKLVVFAGDRDDRVRLDDATGFPFASFHGQAGKDTLEVSSRVGLSPLLEGGNGDDTLRVNMNSGGDVPVLRGGAGADVLELLQVDGGQAFGGAGNDRISTGSDGSGPLLRLDGEGGNDTYTFLVPFRARPDALVPGPGYDTLDESGVLPHPFLSFEFDMNQCAPGCVEQVIGTAGDDTITGDARSQVIAGGPGNDTLDGGGGVDVISGDDGDDTIAAQDGVFDTVGCDGGLDTVLADAFDLVSPACENVTRAGV